MDILTNYFKENNKVALAFSGGMDSSYLLYEAVKAGADVTAYYVRSQFQPEFEFKDAVKVVECISREFGEFRTIGLMKTIDLDILAIDCIRANDENRCYHCKKVLMANIMKAAAEEGYGLLIDGNNASDDESDRPGMRATAELGVRSPLRELGITKEEVQRLSEEAGLPTANKPAYACLATRVPTGEPITEDKLITTEKTEDYLHDLGFSDVRIRFRGRTGVVQVRSEQDELLKEKKPAITKELGKHYEDLAFEKR